MNDEELIDALRKTLRARAESISPSPDRDPLAGPRPSDSWRRVGA